jgi:hypothetical protein
MGHLLATDGRTERLVSVHKRKLERVRRLWLDLRLGRTVGLGLLPLWTLVQSANRVRMGLGAWQGLGCLVGVVASGA